jgi:hypothetical protein
MLTAQNLADARPLSLLARLGVALCCFEQYCRTVGLDAPAVRDFTEYMWEWPLMMSPGWFEEWESKQPTLVVVGLGDPIPQALASLLVERGIDSGELQTLLEATVEIIWGSFYAACDDDGSLAELQRVVAICERRGIAAPPVDVFVESRFDDGHGWGNRVTREQRDRWRSAGAV